MTDMHNIPKEGDLYMEVNRYGYTFELRYGYYEETDRKCGEPVAIYPDLKNNPIYTAEGYRLVTAVQTPCEYYNVAGDFIPEECCGDCIYYNDSKNEIDICLCEINREQANDLIQEAINK